MTTTSRAHESAQFFGYETPIEMPHSQVLDAFHRGLDRAKAKKGKVRILQFGASHTAADLWTGHFRKLMQERFGDGGLGFIMPVRPWRYYRHDGIRFEHPKRKKYRWKWDFVRSKPKKKVENFRLGLAGMRVSARKRRQWSRLFTTTGGRGRMQLEFFYEKKRGGGDLLLTIDDKIHRRIRTQRRKRALGSRKFDLKYKPHTILLRPRGNGEVQLYGAVIERDQPGVVVDTLGINGARARSILKWDQKRWSELLQRRKPDLVILAYGTNEAMDTHEPIRIYREKLNAVLSRLKKTVPKSSCLLIGPTDHPWVHRESKEDDMPWFEHRTRTDDIIRIQRELSKKHRCAFWDATAVTGGPLSIINWAHNEPQMARQDYVHFTTRGYRRLAELFYQALIQTYEKQKHSQ